LVRESRKRIWNTEPHEVKKLLKIRSYGQNCMVVLYAESETRQLVDFLYCLKVATKREKVELESIKEITKVLLEFYASKFNGWYQMSDTANLFKEIISAIDEITDKVNFNMLLEELLLYVGRLNFWIEVKIPWYAIIGIYEWVVHKKF